MLPEWIARMPVLGQGAVVCPMCGSVLEPPPSRSRLCPQCGYRFYVRTCPDGLRRVLDEDAMVEVDCLRAEAMAEGMVSVAAIGSPVEIERLMTEAIEQTRRELREDVLRQHGRL